MNDLVLCSSCSRHVRRSEERCPFCGTTLAEETRRARPPVAPAGLSRARLYAFHAAVATTVAAGVIASGCGGTTAPTGDAGPADARSGDVVASDGESTADAEETGAQDASTDRALIPPDAGADADAIADTGADHDAWGPPPPPYGCVFPEGCGDVKV